MKAIKRVTSALLLFLITGAITNAAAQMPKKPHNFANRKHVITQHFKKTRGTTVTPYTRKPQN